MSPFFLILLSARAILAAPTTYSIDPFISSAFNGCSDAALCQTCEAQYDAYTSTAGPVTTTSYGWDESNDSCMSALTATPVYSQSQAFFESCFPITSSVSVFNDFTADFVASAPCCGQCTIYADVASVIAFPPNQPNFTEYEYAEGVTLTSGTIYLAFETLSAQNLCDQVGDQHVSTPIPIPNGVLQSVDLSAYVCDGVNQIETMSYNTQSIGSLASKCNVQWDNIPHHDYDYYESLAAANNNDNQKRRKRQDDDSCSLSQNNVDLLWQKCHPQIVIPSAVLAADLAWTDCVLAKSLALDPPHYLSQRRSLDMKKRKRAVRTPPPSACATGAAQPAAQVPNVPAQTTPA